MKTKLFTLAALALLAFGCTKYDDSSLSTRVSTLESQLAATMKTVQELQNTLATAQSKGLTVTVTPVTGGNKITFSDGTSFTIYDGATGSQGPQGPEGPQGPAGTGADFKIDETETSYIFTIGDKKYEIAKTVFFAIQLEKTALTLEAGKTAEIGYTIKGANETDDVHVFVAQAEGYAASVKEDAKKLVITAPETLPETGFVVISAINNTTSQQSSQYVSFNATGELEVIADIQEVEAKGGVVTLDITYFEDFEIIVPEDVKWISVSDTKTKASVQKYLIVAENTSEAARQALITVKTASDSKQIAISQKGNVEPIARPEGSILVLLEGTAGANEILFSDLIAKLADESGSGETNPNRETLNGKTFFFPNGTYEFPKKASCTFTEKCTITFIGDNPTFVAAPTSSNSKNQRQFFSVKDNCDYTFENINFIDASADGNSNGAAFWVGGGDVAKMASLTVKNCSFKNCSATKGPCLFAKNAATIVAENCKFIDCAAGQGGAIGTDSSLKEINITVTDCHFENCQVSSYGGAIDACKVTNFICTGSTFTNCSATSESGTSMCGSAIAIGSSSAPASSCVIDGCTFDGCNGPEVIAVYKSTADVPARISNCVFKNNTVSPVGKIGASYPTGVIGAKCPVWVSNCSFFDNTVESGNAIYGRQALLINDVVAYGGAISKGEDGTDTGEFFIGNSTVIAASDAAAVVSAADAKAFNNLIYNTKDGGNALSVAATYTGGNNILGPAAGVTTAATDQVIATLSGSWDATTAQFIWDGPAASFTKITPAGYQAAADVNFYAWLTSINAFASRGGDATWWPGAYQGESQETPAEITGTGTISDPYVLSTAEHLTKIVELAKKVTYSSRASYFAADSTCFKLGADIDLKGADWTPIVLQMEKTAGQKIDFDGNGKTIKNFKVTGSEKVGFFSTLVGNIHDLRVTGAEIITTGKKAGILVGQASTGDNIFTFTTRCYVQGKVSCPEYTTVDVETSLGGVIGQQCFGEISECEADVTIEFGGYNEEKPLHYAGGIVGSLGKKQLVVKNCISRGTYKSLAGSNTYMFGGIVGCAQNKDSNVIENCISLAGINCYDLAGGIIGELNGNSDSGISDTKSRVTGCIAWNDEITITSTAEKIKGIGAIVGLGGRVGIQNCYFKPELPFDSESFYDPGADATIEDVRSYNGKIAASGKTASQIAAEIGWDTAIWDLTGDVPALKCFK